MEYENSARSLKSLILLICYFSLILTLKYLIAAHNFVIIVLVLIVLPLAFDIGRNKKSGIKIKEIRRNKGLGEMSPEAFKYILGRDNYTAIEIEDNIAAKGMLEICFVAPLICWPLGPKVARKLSGTCPEVVRKLTGSCPKVAPNNKRRNYHENGPRESCGPLDRTILHRISVLTFS